MEDKEKINKRYKKLKELLDENNIYVSMEADKLIDIENLQFNVIINFINAQGDSIESFDINRNTFFTDSREDILNYICTERLDIVEKLYEKLDGKTYSNIKNIKYILSKLTRRDILEQLTEEASEVAEASNRITMVSSKLAQYSNKLIRATENTMNVTPLSKDKIVDSMNSYLSQIKNYKDHDLIEECNDIDMCIDLLNYIDESLPIEGFNTLDNPKWERWAKRILQKEQAQIIKNFYCGAKGEAGVTK